MRAGLALFCLAALFSAALASRELVSDEFDSGRQLLQTPNATDCSRSVPNCKTCRYQFFRGTVTKAICLTCELGYAVKASGRACWCAPGYYKSAANTCTECGLNHHCPGARSTADSATRTFCGTNKVTTNNFAKSERECVVVPGYGWASGNSSTVCQPGFYNPGFNTRACTRCPGGLMTETTAANTSTACLAPAGYYYLRGKAIACAQGFFKPSLANADCTSCNLGWTTQFGAVAKTAATDCVYLQPGYSADAGVAIGEVNATVCTANTYRSNEVLYDNTTATTCVSCPDNMQTLPGVEGATSPDACLAKPGYGWNAAQGNATVCDLGFYNPGWNREACVSCSTADTNSTITTLEQESTSPDQCYTPAGHGNKRSATGTLEGFECPKGTYGRSNNTFGLVDVECTKCLDHSTTNTTASTSQAACLTEPGYGWYSGQVLECDYGTWSYGFSQQPCSLCGEGYNTTNTTTPVTYALTGSDEPTDCQIAAGWQLAVAGDSTKGLAPCTRGNYKELIGETTCSQCPNGTTTAITVAATELSDCNSCRPGFGGSSIDLEAPVCAMCLSGTYGSGYKVGGEVCTDCPKPDGFTGDMVSRNGIFTPEDCVGEFPSDGTDNFLEWDILSMGDGILLGSSQPTVADCQDACKQDLACQYFAYYTTYNPDGVNNCYLRSAAAAIAKVDATTTLRIMFEVKEGIYAAYVAKDGADALAVGDTLATFDTFDLAKASCDATASCAGFARGTASTYRTFAGKKWEDAVGKVRVVGATLNSWVAEPTP